MNIENLDLKEFFQRYNYFENGKGFKDLENEIKELEQSKYNIRGYSFNDRVQTSFKDNDRIENINLKMDNLKIEIEKNKALLREIHFFFDRAWQNEFKFLFEFYIEHDGKKEKYKKYKGVNGWDFRKKFDKAIDLIIPIIKSALYYIELGF